MISRYGLAQSDANGREVRCRRRYALSVGNVNVEVTPATKCDTDGYSDLPVRSRAFKRILLDGIHRSNALVNAINVDVASSFPVLLGELLQAKSPFNLAKGLFVKLDSRTHFNIC